MCHNTSGMPHNLLFTKVTNEWLIKDVYLRPVDSQRITDWITEQNSSSAPSIPDDHHFSQIDSGILNTPSKHTSSDIARPHLPIQQRCLTDDQSLNIADDNAIPVGPRSWQQRRSSHHTNKRQSTDPRDHMNYRKALKRFKLGDSPREISSSSSSQSTRTTSTARASKPNLNATISSPLANLTSTSKGSSVATDSTITVINHGPELAAISDLAEERSDYPFEDTEGGLDFFDSLRPLCTQRGRVLSTTLHEPVRYSTSAIADRLFGGTVQEIQLVKYLTFIILLTYETGRNKSGSVTESGCQPV